MAFRRPLAVTVMYKPCWDFTGNHARLPSIECCLASVHFRRVFVKLLTETNLKHAVSLIHVSLSWGSNKKPPGMAVCCKWGANHLLHFYGEGTPRKLATATQPQFPILLAWVEHMLLNGWGNGNPVSSVCAAPFSNMCSTRANNNSRKLRLSVSLVCPRP
jgi:hypothetical protein